MRLFTRTTPFQLESLESRRLLSALIVNSAADSGIGSLRAQIAAAQSGDTISFAPSLFGQTITLTSDDLAITKGLTIQGPGADRLTISGNDQRGVFRIGATSPVAIRDLTLAHGYNGGGGAIGNIGTLTISGCTLSGNATYYGSDGGGAIWNSGTLTISGSTLSGNTAYDVQGGGGAIKNYGGALTISNSTLSNNRAIGITETIYDDEGNVIGFQGYNAAGGGVYNVGGTVSIDHSTLAGNHALGGWGAFGHGGAIYGSAIQLYDTIIADNSADSGPDVEGGFTSLGHNLIGNASGASGFGATDLLNVNPQLGPLQHNGGPTQTMALLAGSPAINSGDSTNAPAYDQRGFGFPRIVGGTIDIGAFESSNGAAKTWVGPTSGGSWSTPANWSPSGVPTASDVVSISASAVTASTSVTVAGLNLTGGASLAVATDGNRVVQTTTLFISANSTLNLNDNDLILDYTGASSLAAIQALISSARNSGAWNGNGISSTSAAANANHSTTLGAMEATDFKSVYGQSATFDNETIDNTAVLVKYTYYGDADFNGRVNFDDYVRTDNGFNNSRSGWLNGDFDGNGQVNFDDYVLIDLAFNTQSGVL